MAIVRHRTEVEAEVRRAAAAGARILARFDAGYPARPEDLRGAPPVVYVRGSWDGSACRAVAIVGTRRPSPYGRGSKSRRGAGEAGVVVISGLARGIDQAAHVGVLRRGGTTVAVLGCGVDVAYLSEHRHLMEAMLARGAAVSEAPMGVHPAPQRFPLRNRLISGLAEAVVDSGSLITARHAADQGRAVYAVPGSVFASASRGPHDLLARGAALLQGPADLLDPLDLGALARPDEHTAAPLDADEARVLEALDEELRHIDGIIERAGLGAGRALAALVTLELRGLVRSGVGRRFARCAAFDRLESGGDTWPNHP